MDNDDDDDDVGVDKDVLFIQRGSTLWVTNEQNMLQMHAFVRCEDGMILLDDIQFDRKQNGENGTKNSNCFLLVIDEDSNNKPENVVKIVGEDNESHCCVEVQTEGDVSRHTLQLRASSDGVLERWIKGLNQVILQLKTKQKRIVLRDMEPGTMNTDNDDSDSGSDGTPPPPPPPPPPPRRRQSMPSISGVTGVTTSTQPEFDKTADLNEKINLARMMRMQKRTPDRTKQEEDDNVQKEMRNNERKKKLQQRRKGQDQQLIRYGPDGQITPGTPLALIQRGYITLERRMKELELAQNEKRRTELVRARLSARTVPLKTRSLRRRGSLS